MRDRIRVLHAADLHMDSPFSNNSMAPRGAICQEVSMDIRVGDVLSMKKAHPCGEKRWLVLRTGADFRLRCMGCGHEVMLPRFKAEKNIRDVHRPEK